MFGAVIRHSLNPVVLMDASGTVIYASLSIQPVLGYSPEEFQGLNALELLHPEDMPELLGIFQQLVEQPGSSFSREFRYSHKDGSWIWLQGMGTNLLGDPEVQAIVTSFSDITNRKQAEEQMAFLASLVASSAYAMVGFSDDGAILSWNPGAEQLFGYNASEMLGKSVNPLVPPELQPEPAMLAKRIRQGEHISDYETIRLRKDGTRLEVSLNISPIIDSDGVFRGQSAIAREITESKASEKALWRRSQELAILNTITAAASRSLELPAIFSTLKELLAQQLGVPGGCLYSFDSATKRLMAADSWGIPEMFVEWHRKIRIDDFHSAPALLEKRPLILDRFPHCTLAVRRGSDVTLPDWNSYICIPLLANDELQGIVELFGPAPGWFDEAQLPFYRILGQQIGVAICNAKLFQEVRDGQARMRALTAQLVHVQELERRWIAGELHDEIGQELTALKLLLECSQRTPQHQSERIEQAQQQVNELIGRVRDISLALRPPLLDDLGLLPALRRHFQRYQEQTGIQVAFETSETETLRFPEEVEIAAYRIVQEALTNVARYAGVDSVQVRLHSELDNQLLVEIEDHGVGFDTERVLANRFSFGLTGAEERARLAGGILGVEAHPGVGVRLTARLPLNGQSSPGGV